MKRFLIVLGVLALLFDLAEDGVLGQIKPMHLSCPFHAGHTSATASHLNAAKACPDKVDCQGAPPVTQPVGFAHSWPALKAVSADQHIPHLIDFQNMRSSGGLPL